MRERIFDTGLSVVYEPLSGSPIVDIILVHGLHGHPYKSWTTSKRDDLSSRPDQLHQGSSEDVEERRESGIRHAVTNLSWKSAKSSSADTSSTHIGKDVGKGSKIEPELAFWPGEFLPNDCPNARILSFGYDSKITKYLHGPTNKGSLLAHGKDLLFSVGRDWVINRPIVFVAHSLGGIVVKEALAHSSMSTDLLLKKVVESTAAVVFLGTPHRGSPDLAALGEYVRSIVSIFRIETTPFLLDALGLKSTDLERAQESFSALWQTHDFQVKTFQEGLPVSKVNFGILAAKVVPDYSSSLGDHRERVETLQANHKEMCRYHSDQDPNYRKVAGELRSIYDSISKLDAEKVYHKGLPQHREKTASETPSTQRLKALGGDTEFTDAEVHALQSLWLPGLHSRHHKIEKPAEGTCSSIFQQAVYQEWLEERARDSSHGLLWIKGKPGAGKSVFMKEALHKVALLRPSDLDLTAGFFFSAKDNRLDQPVLGLWRSLLHQLLLKDRQSLQDFCSLLNGADTLLGYNRATKVENWEEDDFRSFFLKNYTQNQSKTIFIFIDALDECDAENVRRQAYFWREATMAAHFNGVHLNVCLSSRHFPSVTLSNCPEIVLEAHNGVDIASYVEQRFKLGIATEERKWETLKDSVLQKSSGIFLWAVLIVEEILSKWEEGKDLRSLLKLVDTTPVALETLFSQMLSHVTPEANQMTLRLFQWAVLSRKPLRLYEWHHILAFIQDPAPRSLAAWRGSDSYTENDEQLERRLRTMSKGLLEVRPDYADEAHERFGDAASLLARAGSLNLEIGETRVVQVIHESVREFFLSGQGFSALDPKSSLSPLGKGHLSMLRTCLDYLEITELDALIRARAVVKEDQTVKATSEHERADNGALMDVDNTQPFRLEIPRSQIKGRHEPKLVLQTLSRLDEADAIVDVARWMEASQLALTDAPSNGSIRHSAMYSSDSGRSQVLEDFPALLSYATYEVFTHALGAQRENINPVYIVSRLESEGLWGRLRALREDLPRDLLLYQCAQSHNLYSWLEYIRVKEHPQMILKPEPLTQLKQLDPSVQRQVERFSELTLEVKQYRCHRSRSSVASFTSAGSYTGSGAGSASQGSYASFPMGIEYHYLDTEDALRPDPGTESNFAVENNPFAFTPGQLNKMFNPKSLAAFAVLGGVKGIERGLRTDIKAGLSIDETCVRGQISFEEATDYKDCGNSFNPTEQYIESVESAEPYKDRIRVFCQNILPERRMTPVWKLLWNNINDFFCLLLLTVTIVALALEVLQSVKRDDHPHQLDIDPWANKVTVVATLMVSLIVQSLRQSLVDRISRRINVKSEAREVKTIRSGRVILINADDILVGDILFLQPGDIVPVDGVCVSAYGLKFDESRVTGESDFILKTSGEEVSKAIEDNESLKKMDPFIQSGSMVIEGTGRYICTSVGIHSSFGKIMMAMREDEDATPLSEKTQKAAVYLARSGAVAAVILLIVLSVRFLADLPEMNQSAMGKSTVFMDLLLVVVALIFFTIPQEYPETLSSLMSLAQAMMDKQNVLGRSLRQTEAMGVVTAICTEMDDILLTSEMAVEVLDVEHAIWDESADPGDEKVGALRAFNGRMSPDLQDILRRAIALNTSAFEDFRTNSSPYLGSQTDMAVILFARDHLGLDKIEAFRSNYVIVDYVNFGYMKAWKGTIIKHHSKYRMFVCGPSCTLLGWCTEKVDASLETTVIGPIYREHLLERAETFGSQGLKMISFAYMDLHRWPDEAFSDLYNDRCGHLKMGDPHGLVLICTLGIRTSVRTDVPAMVSVAQRAGLGVRLVTKENMALSKAIASECEILKDDGIAMTGSEFRNLSQEEMDVVMPKLQVLSNCSSYDKQALVAQLQLKGETVCLVSNKPDDAIALRNADAGVCVNGFMTADAARERSGIMLDSRGLASILDVVKMIRTVKDNAQRFIQSHLPGMMVILFFVFLTATSSKEMEPVITPAQIGWIYLVMNPLMAFLWAFCVPLDSVLDRPPAKAVVITITMWKMILGQFVYQLAVLLALRFSGPKVLGHDLGDPEQKLELHTIIFNAFVWMQFFNAINCRIIDNKFNVVEGFFRHIWFFVFLLVLGGLQVTVVQLGAVAFHVRPSGLGIVEWAICIACGFLSIVWRVFLVLVPDVWVAGFIGLLAKAATVVRNGCAHLWKRIRGMRTGSDEEEPPLHIEIEASCD